MKIEPRGDRGGGEFTSVCLSLLWSSHHQQRSPEMIWLVSSQAFHQSVTAISYKPGMARWHYSHSGV